MRKIHPKSQTTQILYQQPSSPVKLDWRDILSTTLKNICAGAIVAVCFFSIALLSLRGCKDEIERQTAMVVKYQLSMGAEK